MKEKIDKIIKSDKFKKTAKILFKVFIALLIFEAGVLVGFKKASYSFKIGENYFRKMIGSKMGDDFNFERPFKNPHGSGGKIILINKESLVIEDVEGIEKEIYVSTTTEIKKFSEDIKFEDLKVGDKVIIFGSPDKDARILAKLIRIMPDPKDL